MALYYENIVFNVIDIVQYTSHCEHLIEQTMNTFLWKFLEIFFKFQNIMCFNFTSEGIPKFNRKLLILNVVLPNVRIILFTSAAMFLKVEKFIRAEGFILRDVSLLLTRILRIFPVVLTISSVSVNFFALYLKKIYKIAKLLAKIKNLINLDMDSINFKQFEIRSFVIFITYYSFLFLGMTLNMISILKPTVESFIFVNLVTWTMYASSHLIFLYALCIDFISTMIQQIEVEILQKKKKIPVGLMKLHFIGQILDEIKLNLKFPLTFAYFKSIFDILVRVSVNNDCTRFVSLLNFLIISIYDL